jgi:hypothetical protein
MRLLRFIGFIRFAGDITDPVFLGTCVLAEHPRHHEYLHLYQPVLEPDTEGHQTVSAQQPS